MASDRLSCRRARLKVIFRLLVLTELLPPDRVLGWHIKALVQHIAIDGASHTVDAKVEVAELLTRVVSFLAKDYVRAARFAHEAASIRLQDCSLGIFPQLSVALRVESDCVSFDARQIRLLAETIDHTTCL